MRKVLLPFPVLALLAGCANLNDPTTAIVTVETAYAGAVSAEIVYLNSGKADPVLVKQIEGYRLNAHGVLAPLAEAAGSGTPPTSDAAAAAHAAVTGFVEFLKANKIGSN